MSKHNFLLLVSPKAIKIYLALAVLIAGVFSFDDELCKILGYLAADVCVAE
jgi:hypothetical protein